MRTATTPEGDARRRVQDLVEQLPEGGEASFDKPWELRAFAIAVAAHENGQYGWSEFQLALVDAIRQWERGGSDEPWQYYERWLDALETVLSGTGVLDVDQLDGRTHTVMCTPPDKSHHVANHDPIAVDPGR